MGNATRNGSATSSESLWLNAPRVFAGVAERNVTVFHRIRFAAPDPVAVIEWPSGKRTLIIRDIEVVRARAAARANEVYCPADFTPAGGLSGDRELAVAESLAECMRRVNTSRVVGDRSLPLVYVHALREAGVEVTCDPYLGVADRRAKDEQELVWLAEAQTTTEAAMRMAATMVLSASAEAESTVRGDAEAGDGDHAEGRRQLMLDGELLTSERVRVAIDRWLLERGYDNPQCIVAGGPMGADPHERGSGPLCTGEPIIIDIFPRNRTTHFWGDCTRTIVHGRPSDTVIAAHAAVCQAKVAAIATVRAGVSASAVHDAATAVIVKSGYVFGSAAGDGPVPAMVHGTGHGVGLDIHEAPLLDAGGPALVVGDVITIEPGLYHRAMGGIRVEDMVVVTETGCRNLNRLPESLALVEG